MTLQWGLLSHLCNYMDVFQVKLYVVAINYKKASCDLDYFSAWSTQPMPTHLGNSYQ